MYGLDNKDLNLKGILDYKGNLRAEAVKNLIIMSKQNQYYFKNWPFPNQTPQELLLYLWKYGKVLYLEINGQLNFFPFESSKPFLTRGNVHLATLTIKENFNKRVLTKNFINDAVKKSFPFIFLNPLQTAPEQQQEQIFEALKAVYNSNNSNRQNKNKSHIVFVPAGAKYNKAIYAHYTNPDASPFYYIENKAGNKNSNLKASDFNQMTTNTQNLYDSYSQEEKDIKQELKFINGMPSNINFGKGSAQETNNQTENQKVETAFILKNELDQLRRDFKNLRSNYPKKQVEAFLTDEIFNYIYNALNLLKEETKELTPEATEETKANKSLIERIKNLIGIKSKTNKPETEPEQEETPPEGVNNV